jgi:hypothetical protein
MGEYDMLGPSMSFTQISTTVFLTDSIPNAGCDSGDLVVRPSPLGTIVRVLHAAAAAAVTYHAFPCKSTEKDGQRANAGLSIA